MVALQMYDVMGKEEWCRGAESNCGHEAFQASALPTELPRHHAGRLNERYNNRQTG
jgi:hypothetical protein